MAQSLRRPDRGLVEVAVRQALAEGGVTFTRVAEPNVRRAYWLSILPNLFGGLDLVRAWGRYRPGRPPGKPRHIVEQYEDEGQLLQGLRLEVRRRIARKYRLHA